MGLRHYACVLVVSATRFTENDRALIDELDRVAVPYCCIRSKFDQDRDNELKRINQKRKPKLMSLTAREVDSLLKQIKSNLVEQKILQPYVLSAYESEDEEVAICLAKLPGIIWSRGRHNQFRF